MARNKVWLGILFWACAILGMFLPMSILLIVKREEYFTPTQSEDMVWGLMIALVFAVLMFAGALKDMNKKFMRVFTLIVLAAVSYFLQPLMDDFMWVCLSAAGGYIIFIPLQYLGNVNLDYDKVYRKEKIKIQARKEAESEDAFI